MYKRPKEVGTKISKGRLDRKALLGYLNSPEARAKMSAARKGKPSNAKGKKHRIPAWNKGKKMFYPNMGRKSGYISARKGVKLPNFSGIHHPRWINITNRICKECNNNFETKENSKQKFCSRKCSYSWNRNNKRAEKSLNWKGGITPINKLIRCSPEYINWRKKVFERDNFICQECKEKGGVLHSHHKKPFASFPELRFDSNNGITLCKKCHLKVKHKAIQEMEK